MYARQVKLAQQAAYRQWAREYGRGMPDNIGYASVNALYNLERHAGYMPPSGGVRAPVATDADNTDRSIRAYAEDNFKYSRVLMCEYMHENDYMKSKLDRLSKIGINISHDTYARWLEDAENAVWELRKGLVK